MIFLSQLTSVDAKDYTAKLITAEQIWIEYFHIQKIKWIDRDHIEFGKLTTANTRFDYSIETDGIAISFQMKRVKPRIRMTSKEQLQQKEDALQQQMAAARAKLEADMYSTITGLDPGNVLMVGGVRMSRGARTELIKLKNRHVRHRTGEINRRKKLKNWTGEFEERVKSTISPMEPDYLVCICLNFSFFFLKSNLPIIICIHFD